MRLFTVFIVLLLFLSLVFADDFNLNKKTFNDFNSMNSNLKKLTDFNEFKENNNSLSESNYYNLNDLNSSDFNSINGNNLIDLNSSDFNSINENNLIDKNSVNLVDFNFFSDSNLSEDSLIQSNKKKFICGNSIIEETEQCELNIDCKKGFYCKECKCIKSTEDIIEENFEKNYLKTDLKKSVLKKNCSNIEDITECEKTKECVFNELGKCEEKGNLLNELIEETEKVIKGITETVESIVNPINKSFVLKTKEVKVEGKNAICFGIKCSEVGGKLH